MAEMLTKAMVFSAVFVAGIFIIRNNWSKYELGESLVMVASFYFLIQCVYGYKPRNSPNILAGNDLFNLSLFCLLFGFLCMCLEAIWRKIGGEEERQYWPQNLFVAGFCLLPLLFAWTVFVHPFFVG